MSVCWPGSHSPMLLADVPHEDVVVLADVTATVLGAFASTPRKNPRTSPRAAASNAACVTVSATRSSFTAL